MNIPTTIASVLLRKEAVKVSINPPFTWVSGIKSPVYCDNRKMISFPEERTQIVQAFIQKIKEKGLSPDVIGGTATAAIPWAAFLAQAMNLPMVYIRPEKKTHGAGKQIEGQLPPNSKVLIIEDLISTGGSSIKAAEVVRQTENCTVTDIFAIVSWEMPQVNEKFANANISLTTLTNYTGIIQTAAETGAIGKEAIDTIMKFKENPKEWGRCFTKYDLG